jgi:hypothetical protein
MNQPAPVPPSNLNPNSPEFQAYYQDFTRWAEDKEKARIAAGPKVYVDNRDEWPKTTQEGTRKPPIRQKPAWGLHDQNYMREAKQRQRERDKVSPRPCKDCKTAPRLPRGSRCLACKDKEEDRQEAMKHTKRRMTDQVITVTASKK